MRKETLRQEAANRLRRAVTREDYNEVQTAVADYRREVEAEIAAWQRDQPAPVDVVREAVDLTRWALTSLRAARARNGQKLDQVSAVLRYHSPAQARPTWRLDG